MRRVIKVCLGETAVPVGRLLFTADGGREASAFAYDETWLGSPDAFPIDPALPLVQGAQYHAQARHEHASVFHGCFADSEPDGWGIQVIRRDWGKRRQEEERGGGGDRRRLNTLDCLLYVDDIARIGALRFMDETGAFVRPPPGEGRAVPPLIELSALLNASRAVEAGTETAADLRFLLGKGTSVGGMRPKCTVVDHDGSLCIGKFPSRTDSRSVTRGEVLALRLAAAAGIDAAEARVVVVDGEPVTLVRRFDRNADGKRKMYASAHTMLGFDDGQEHAYTELAEVLRRSAKEPGRDLEELWRRVAYNVLITNVDDHLNNHGFLHLSRGRWRLSPAFDINPFPDKARTLKTWISEDSGPEASIDAVMGAARYFGLTNVRAGEILGEVVGAVEGWRRVAMGPDVGMTAREIEQFTDAFDHEESAAARKLVQPRVAVHPRERAAAEAPPTAYVLAPAPGPVSREPDGNLRQLVVLVDPRDPAGTVREVAQLRAASADDLIRREMVTWAYIQALERRSGTSAEVAGDAQLRHQLAQGLDMVRGVMEERGVASTLSRQHGLRRSSTEKGGGMGD